MFNNIYTNSFYYTLQSYRPFRFSKSIFSGARVSAEIRFVKPFDSKI